MTRALVPAVSVLVLAGAAAAEPFTVELTGRCDANLGGRVGTSVPYTITFVGDTEDRMQSGSLYEIVGTSCTFTVDGVGSGEITIATRIFVNQAVQAAGLSRASGTDLLDLRSAQFATWDLLTSIGPIFDPSPFAVHQFANVPTTAGDLTLTAIDVTFTAEVGGCYADCDGSTTLDIFDFLCFQDAFVAHDPYGDCTGEGTYDIFDFLCFQDAFVTGCP